MNNKETPIFIFSSSWRSGSTLLQRYITASGEALIWGETGGALNALRKALGGWEQITADGSRRFEHSTGGNGERVYKDFISTPKPEHAQQWIANLTPPYAEVISCMRSLLIDIYAKRAEELSYSRFGIKETRCDLGTANFLRTLFPSAKFVFLVRNPLDVILSIKRRDWMGRSSNNETLRYYAQHWLIRSSQFRMADFGMTLRYEDFISDAALRDKLMDYLEISTSPPKDFTGSSHVDWRAQNQTQLSWWEKHRVRLWLSEEMKNWGY